VLVHSYFAVSSNTIWDIAHARIPELREVIRELLEIVGE
jgi:uncharacterized protein with HEPN domain